MLDLNSHVSVAQSIAPRTFDTDGTVDGSDVDLANFDAAVVLLEAGTWATDGSYAFNIQHADDDGAGSPDTYSDVAAADLDGSEITVTSASNDNVVAAVGYIGNKRWLRVQMTTSGNTSGTLEAAAHVVRGKGRKHT